MLATRPWIIAHRGASLSFRENTFAAFDAAMLAQVDAIELDLQLSRDGVAVAYHDKTLHRVNRSRKGIAHHTYQELRELGFGAWFDPKEQGETIPTLDELLIRYAPHVTLMLELKAESTDTDRQRQLVEAVVECLRVRGVEDRIYLLSFERRMLEMALELQPNLPCVLTVSSSPGGSEHLQSSLAGLRALCLPGRYASTRITAAVRELGKQVFCYRCDSARAANNALRAQVDGLMADDPNWLHALVDSHGPW